MFISVSRFPTLLLGSEDWAILDAQERELLGDNQQDEEVDVIGKK